MRIEVKFERVVDGMAYEDSDLEKSVQLVLGKVSIVDYIQKVVEKIYQFVGANADQVGYLGVRICQTDNPRTAFAFKPSRKVEDFLPSMMVGFAGSLEELTKNIIHEFLHYSEWDEWAVENKTREIYNALGEVRETKNICGEPKQRMGNKP